MTKMVTARSFEQEVLQAEGPVLLDFYADWCMPCKMMAAVIEDLDAEAAGVKICKINIDEEPELAARFQIMSIPTLVVMQDGEIVEKATGVRGKGEILEMLPLPVKRRSSYKEEL